MVEPEKPDPLDAPTPGPESEPSQHGDEGEPDIWPAEEGEAAGRREQPADAGEAGDEEEEYRLVEEPTLSGKPASETADWYFIVGDQPRQGPVSLGDLQRRVAAGQLGRDDRVWRSGLPEWASVADVPELFREASPPPTPKPRPAVEDDDELPDASTSLRAIERKLTEPAVFRAIGWACGVLGATVAAVSVPLVFFGRSWFIGAMVLLLAFLVLHGLARLMEASGR